MSKVKATTQNSKLLEESKIDLIDDFGELNYLLKSALTYLNNFINRLKSIQRHVRPHVYKYTFSESTKLKKKFETQIKEIKILERKLHKLFLSNKSINRFSELRDYFFSLLRTQYNLFGPLITSIDWQSPSFDYSLFSQAGVQTGLIKGTINDYKRDIHLNEESFENRFKQEYIDSPFKLFIRCFMTSSGMSAFSTILNYLTSEKKISTILSGNNVYFQYKQIISGVFKDKISFIAEENTEEIIKTVQNVSPDVLFFDSLSNSAEIPIPDLDKIIDFLERNAKKETYLVIDNTGLSVFFQPFKKKRLLPSKLRIILFESLMKYHHFGLDRATGGIITCAGKDIGKIAECRKHTGSNIADSSVYMFPIPNRIRLEKRMKRLERNASLLASSLHGSVYPQNHSFCGSFFNIKLKNESIRKYKKFINTVISEAKKEKIQLVAGTSFGLNHTRIYLTSLWSKYSKPFLRVSVGMENRLEMEKLKYVFKKAIEKI